MLFLDTTVLIDALRGRPAAARIEPLARAGETLLTCAINIEELYRGLRPTERRAAERLLRGLRIAPLGAGEGRRAGEWRRAFQARGRTLSQADCLIASSAFGAGAVLATGNPKDFPMKGLKLEHWPVGE